MNIREVTDKIYAMDDREKMEAANELYYEAAENLRRYDENKYKELVDRAEAICYQITREEAQDIVRYMRPYGEYWPHDTIREFIASKGIMDHVTDYYLVMNMMYNDYRNTAAMIGADNPDFYFSLAKDFIMDEDGSTNKVGKYFKM